MVVPLIAQLVSRGGRLARRRHRKRPSPPSDTTVTLGGPQDAFQILQKAMLRQLEWADDFRRAGDVASAMTAAVDAAAIAGELGVNSRLGR